MNESPTIKNSRTQDIVRLLPVLNDTRIATLMGCSREWVRQVRNKYKIKSPIPYASCSVVTEEKLGEAIRLVNELMPISQISKMLGFETDTLKRVLKKYGVNFGRNTARGFDYPSFLSILKKHNMEPNHKHGKVYTAEHCAKLLGIHIQTFLRWKYRVNSGRFDVRFEGMKQKNGIPQREGE